MRRDHPKALDSTSPNAESGADSEITPQRFNLGNLAITSLLALLGAAADLISKSIVFRNLGMPGKNPPHWIIPEYVGFETSINTGGLFGMFSGNTLPLAIISMFAIGGILWWLTLGGASRDRLMAIILGMILGGILGNLYDRLGLWGIHGVRDWVLFRYKQHVWPNFNIADCLLVCGAALMMWHAFQSERAERRAAATASGTDSATVTS